MHFDPSRKVLTQFGDKFLLLFYMEFELKQHSFQNLKVQTHPHKYFLFLYTNLALWFSLSLRCPA